MPQIDFSADELEMIRETLTYYEDRVRNYPYDPVSNDREAERLRRNAILEKSASIRYRITDSLKAARRPK